MQAHMEMEETSAILVLALATGAWAHYKLYRNQIGL